MGEIVGVLCDLFEKCVVVAFDVVQFKGCRKTDCLFYVFIAFINDGLQRLVVLFTVGVHILFINHNTVVAGCEPTVRNHATVNKMLNGGFGDVLFFVPAVQRQKGTCGRLDTHASVAHLLVGCAWVLL